MIAIKNYIKKEFEKDPSNPKLKVYYFFDLSIWEKLTLNLVVTEIF